ncbi:AraC family transcriptional regulator [Sphaerisporangium rubeum]
MEMTAGVPSGPVRELVDHYHGYLEWGHDPGTHRGLPSPYLTVIFTLREPVQITAHPDPRQAAGRYDTLVGGLHTSPALITHQGRQAGVQLGVSPLAARALFGVPAGELANVDVDAEALLGPAAGELYERLNSAAGWGERFGVLDDVLARRAGHGGQVPREVVRAWETLTRRGGMVTVEELAREVGWSARHLGTRFAAEIGLTPKAAARVVRFDRTRRAVQARAGDVVLADVAAEMGYYDQSHLVREFREFAGCPPTRWLAEEFRNVQAGESSARAQSGV